MATFNIDPLLNAALASKYGHASMLRPGEEEGQPLTMSREPPAQIGGQPSQPGEQVPQPRSAKREFMRNLLGNFLSGLGEGMAAAAGAPKGHEGIAAMAGGLQAPDIRRAREMEMQQRQAQIQAQNAMAQQRQAQAQAIPQQLQLKQEAMEKNFEAAMARVHASLEKGEAASKANMERLEKALGSREKITDRAIASQEKRTADNIASRMKMADNSNATRMRAVSAQQAGAMERTKMMAGMWGDKAEAIGAASDAINSGQIQFSNLPRAIQAGVLLKNAEDGRVIVPKETRKKLVQFNAAQSALDSMKTMLKEYHEAVSSGDIGRAFTKGLQLKKRIDANAVVIGKALGEVGVFTNQDRSVYAGLTSPGLIVTTLSPDTAMEFVNSVQTLFNDVNQREFSGQYQKYNDQITKQPVMEGPGKKAQPKPSGMIELVLDPATGKYVQKKK